MLQLIGSLHTVYNIILLSFLEYKANCFGTFIWAGRSLMDFCTPFPRTTTLQWQHHWGLHPGLAGVFSSSPRASAAPADKDVLHYVHHETSIKRLGFTCTYCGLNNTQYFVIMSLFFFFHSDSKRQHPFWLKSHLTFQLWAELKCLGKSQVLLFNCRFTPSPGLFGWKRKLCGCCCCIIACPPLGRIICPGRPWSPPLSPWPWKNIGGRDSMPWGPTLGPLSTDRGPLSGVLLTS